MSQVVSEFCQNILTVKSVHGRSPPVLLTNVERVPLCDTVHTLRSLRRLDMGITHVPTCASKMQVDGRQPSLVVLLNRLRRFDKTLLASVLNFVFSPKYPPKLNVDTMPFCQNLSQILAGKKFILENVSEGDAAN